MARTANGSGSGRAGRAGAGSGTPASPPLPVLQKETTHPCYNCQLCCTYMAVEIDPPTTNTEYDYMVWYLYHEGVNVFVDWEGDWFLKYDARCAKLTDAGLCGVYENRPVICREFSFLDCERNSGDDAPDKWLFQTADEFIDWLRKQRPKSYARFRQFQRVKKQKVKTAKELRRVKIQDVALPLALATRSGA